MFDLSYVNSLVFSDKQPLITVNCSSVCCFSKTHLEEQIQYMSIRLHPLSFKIRRFQMGSG